MRRCDRFGLIGLLLALGLLGSGAARAQSWMDTAWLFRCPVTITSTNAVTLTNYQVSVTLPSSFNFAAAKLDGSDLRITAADGTTVLPFWLESWNATTRQATLWIKAPSVVLGANTLYLYYGNPAAPSTSSGKSTFELFDDFDATAQQGYYVLGNAQTIMVQDQPWENEAPHTLSVVTAPAGAAYPYYGYYGLEGCTAIGLSGSNDLIHWTKFANNPLFSGHGERWPHVILANGTYFMVHTVDFCGTSSIVYRTSTNGTTWSASQAMVSPVAGQRNQNPNLFRDPRTSQFYLYWYRGDGATVWRIMSRTASTVAGLATAPDVQLLSSPTTLAAPNMMYRDSTYFLSTEIEDVVWKTILYKGSSPTGPFTQLPGNPLMTDGSACLFQTQVGNSIYEYYCKETASVWTVDLRIADGTARQQVGGLDAALWTPSGGDWTSLSAAQQNGATGMVAQGATTANQILKSAYTGGDYVVEGYGRLLGGRTWGLGVRAASASNGYTLNLYDDLDGSTNLYLYRWVSGSATQLWTTSVGTIDKNTWYKLKLKVSGSQISAYFNDVLKTTSPITDTRYATGAISLYGESGTLAQYNDVRVRRVAPTEPGAAVGAEATLGNTRPIAAIGAPAAGSFYLDDVSVGLTSAATDSQDPADSLLYRWDVERRHNADPPAITSFTTRNASFVPPLTLDDAVVSHHLTLRVTDRGGLSDSTALDIFPEVDLAPSAIAVSPAAPNAGDSLTLGLTLRNLGRVRSPLSRWRLMAGAAVLGEADAATGALDSTLISLRVPPLAAGTYTLRLKADTLGAVVETSEANNASVRTLTVAPLPGVNQPPVALATGAPLSGPAPLTVNFSSVGSNDPDGDPLSYAWAFGDGASSTAANPSHAYVSAGSYTATLTVSDGRGGSGVASLSVIASVPAAFPTTAVLDNFDRANGPIGGSWIDAAHGLASMTINSNALVQVCCTYSSPVWNGAVFGANQEAYITLSAVTANAPEHDLMLKVQGTSDAAAHIEVRFDKTVPQVAVGTYDPAVGWASPAPPIAVDFVAGDQFGARAKADGTVEVFKNGTRIATVNASAWAFSSQGGRIGLTLDQTYSSRLDNFGGGNVVADTSATNHAPAANATGTPASGVAGLVTAFSSAGSGDVDGDALTYAWNFGDGQTSTTANPSHTYSAAGQFRAILTVSDGRGGNGRDTVAVTVYARPPMPSVAVLDNFNRANGAPGSPWTGVSGFTINTNQLAQSTSPAFAQWGGATYGANQEAYVTLNAFATGNTQHNLLLKMQGATATTPHIQVRYERNSTRVRVYTYAGTALTLRGTISAVTLVAGDRFGARAYADGRVDVYRNTTLLGTVSVTAWAPYALGGKIGVGLVSAAASRLDDFGGGDILFTPPAPAAIAMMGSDTPRSEPMATPEAPQLPLELALSNPYPNPASEMVTLALTLPRSAEVEFTVFDLQGRVIWHAASREYGPGRWRLGWAGETVSGGRAGPGVYLSRVRVGPQSFTRRFVRVR